jgi:hypothetical protein
MYSLGKDISAELTARFALTSTSVTAAGAGDATEVDGATIDTLGLPGEPSSVVFYIPVRAVLADTKTGVLTANLQDSANGSSWADITTPAVVLTLLGKTGGTTETGIAKLGFDLTKARRYIRIQVTPDLNATSTDTAVVGGGLAVFGGLNEVPSV